MWKRNNKERSHNMYQALHAFHHTIDDKLPCSAQISPNIRSSDFATWRSVSPCSFRISLLYHYIKIVQDGSISFESSNESPIVHNAQLTTIPGLLIPLFFNSWFLTFKILLDFGSAVQLAECQWSSQERISGIIFTAKFLVARRYWTWGCNHVSCSSSEHDKKQM